MILKKRIFLISISLLLLAIYFFGPRFDSPQLDSTIQDLSLHISELDDFITQKESEFDIKKDNQARIIWNNESVKSKTDYSILYLHGFNASWYDGYPLHENLGSYLQANVFLSRLHSHGLEDKDAFLNMTPEALYESSKVDLQIASLLGNKVIVIGTSTGGTLALKLASDFPDLLHSLILLSPNIKINNSAAFLLSGPWGVQIARIVDGGSLYRIKNRETAVETMYWYSASRWEGTVYLQQLIEATMTGDVFKKITQPLFLGYYYKNEDEQDKVVRVSAMLEMFNQIKTPMELKQKAAFPNAGNHVIGSIVKSQSYYEVEEQIIKFVDSIINPAVK